MKPLSVRSPWAPTGAILLALAAAFSGEVSAQTGPLPQDLSQDDALLAREVLHIWDLFVQACAAGDVEMALRYVNPQSDMIPVIRQVGGTGLQRMVANQEDARFASHTGDFVFINSVVRMPDGGHKGFRPMFVRTPGGWLLDHL